MESHCLSVLFQPERPMISSNRLKSVASDALLYVLRNGGGGGGAVTMKNQQQHLHRGDGGSRGHKNDVCSVLDILVSTQYDIVSDILALLFKGFFLLLLLLARSLKLILIFM